MIDINSYYKDFSDKHVILFYSGSLGQDMLVDLISLLESHLKRHESSLKVRKKVINIVLELVQNVYLHMGVEGVVGSNFGDIIFVVTKENNAYGIYGGNFMSSTKVSVFKEKLDSVNSMDEDKLVFEYRERLAAATVRDGRGAGLGIMSMVRRAGKKIQYHFEKTPNKRYSFFSIQVDVSP